MKRAHLLSAIVIFLFGLVFLALHRPATAVYPDMHRLVVRVYFDNRQMLNDLAARQEPWEVNIEQQYAIFDVSQAEYGRLQAAGYRVEIDEVRTTEYNTQPEPLSNQGGGIPGYACYRTVEETFDSAEVMASTYPTLASWTDIGDSWDKLTPGGPDGYDMNVLRLTNSNITGPKPTLLILGGIHAREYVTAETATRFAEYMLANYGTDPDVTWLLDYHEIHLILQTNPDGRKFAETGLLWRKNTNNEDGCGSSDYGVDLNRNQQFHWNTGGSSSNPCSATYHGSGAASEPETQAVQNHEFAIFPDQREAPITATAPLTTTGIFLDLHSYGEEILWSWGFTLDPPPNHDGIQRLARKMGYFSGYDATQSLYTTSGSTKDFAYGELGIPGYTIEIGTTFFQSCTYYENTIVDEMMPTLLYAAKAARYSYITPAGPDVVNLSLSATSVAAGDPVDITAVMDDTRYNHSQGTEPSQNIVAAEYYVDVPPWITATTPISVPMTAVDGTFNSPVENVEATLNTSGLPAGQHTLFVRGQDANGNWGAFSAAFLDVIVSVPTANFSHNSPIATNQPVTFTNSSTGSDLTFQWNFGDGITSTDTHPTHNYTEAMTYTITLTATNNLGTDVMTSTVVVMDLPTAQFSSPNQAAANSPVQFTNLSTGSTLAYLWDFGDGTTSTNVNPTHTFTTPGMHTITLTATNAVGEDETTAVIEVMVTTYLPLILHNSN